MSERTGRGRSGGGRTGWAALGAGLLFLLTKGKTALLLLLKAGKPLLTMLVSVGAYALIYKWQFAIGLVALIFVHELGHMWVASRKGIPVSAPMFIPFVGAAVILRRHPKDAATEADIALGGPVLGSIGAFACYAIGWWTGHPIWMALAYVGFLLNLLNLMPMNPLDGGRIVGAVSRWLWIVGVVIGPLLIWYTDSILFMALWIWFLWQSYARFIRSRKDGKPQLLGEATYRTTVDQSLPDWYLTGSTHYRLLPFTAYCRMDSEHVVEFTWDALDYRGQLPLDAPCIIDKVYVSGIDKTGADGIAQFTVRVEGWPYRSDTYYEVGRFDRTRIAVAYGALIAGLIYMIWQLGEVGLEPIRGSSLF